MAWHVDEAELAAIAEIAVGVAQIDGDAARLLLLEAVGIDAGQRFDQGGLAVVDMARGADDHGDSRGSCWTKAASSSRVRRSNNRVSSWMRPITGIGRRRKASASLSRPLRFPRPLTDSAKDGS